MIGGIIFEGADQQGKTTLAKKVQEKVNMPIMHFGIPDKHTDFSNEYIKDIPKNDFQPIIFDRSYVSEIVYGNIFRGGTGITNKIKAHIEDFLNNCGYILVLCKRKNYKWEERDEDYTESDNIKVMNSYDEVFETVKLPKIIVDPFDSDADQQVVDFWLKNNEELDARPQ